MAFAGLKKQINKANQYMTEKMGGAEGTKLDVDFMDMERKTDVTYELVEELQMKTKEFLQPNPTARAKMAAVKGISKLSGQAKASTYPQPEGVLGDCMLIYGKKLGEDSIFAQALVEMGEAMKQMADVKYSLDDNIKQNFLEPLHHLQTKDLKEVMHHRKKLQGRRLDFDCKRRRQAKATGKRSASPHFGSPVKSSSPYTGSHVSDDEIRQAEEKFAESLHLAQLGMFNLLENDVEQVAQLATFSEGLLEYHQQCTEILRTLTETLLEKKDEAANKPKMEFIPKTLADLHVDALPTSDAMNGGNFSFHGASRAGSPIHGDGKRSQLELFPAGNPPQSANASPLPSPSKSPARTPMTRQPCCTALYDFEAENPGELGFKENDTITLTKKIDENWFEGSLNGRTGYFPVTYVQVVVPLP
ncbi:endophilin-A isoform X2 [Bombus vosnesenskii]|uniref:Endophilin-A n=4 Tax=Bombus TaxID=28641 RepID=A0A6J3K741_9HYME|nr:endophilin-A isoform X2 [Bombus impatiens]XP_033190344.1 endophilin-A isoform X2 [Bombus vancouverensis nearcticus]XP_033303805.1 endophilin-A isoform X2 [Bombus bifarius]XP_033348882.1 endophilin-A isoform X2 [Bombus vosnesenskii]XP_048266538.1 endophilin-A isoform X2 [Bombus terrestris]XP_050471240.1 endophilin-A isoform X1 [Bombus huntii]XP_050471241.1 endophilin-A isoform X1 [Bombus huntii]XP_050581405.1 endophilin-A isoform X1 [Bombus affinis]XP_050581406.1 endophilin-A isoform X1 [